jgi:hypothetical protein
VFSYWINGYWGGSFIALGAMLVVGALPRLLARPGWGLGAVMGLGAAILATTRPVEGALLCLPVAAALLWRFVRPSEAAWRAGFARAVVSASVPLGAGLAILVAYNVAATGNPLQTAYGVNRAAYALAPAFLVAPPVDSQRRGPPHMRTFYEEEAKPHVRRNSVGGIVAGVAAKLAHTWNFYLGPLFTLPFVIGLWAQRRNAFLLGSLGFFLAGYALLTWNFPHYTAPLMPLVLVVLMHGFMQLRAWAWRCKPVGRQLGRSLVLGLPVALALPTASVLTGVPALESSRTEVCCALTGNRLRPGIEQRLQAVPGQHLVMVRSGPHSPLHYEVVYNEPDIDQARIVWARNLDDARDAKLIAAMPGRHVWQFEWRPDLPQAYSLVALPATEPAASRYGTYFPGRGPDSIR